eukprot:GILK01011387.1.p1 GENE.GILK01011387.1~~GILK01011387.1.p1  ORF type:complete len:466 (+),score=38.62 GILK01011387.1:96-1400(+)
MEPLGALPEAEACREPLLAEQYGILAIGKPFDRWWKQNWSTSELSGSLGDLGTFIPLVVGVCIKAHMDFPSVLFFAGLYNFLTGLFFDIPMPVQPMKQIAAAAIASGWSAGAVASSGVVISFMILVLCVSNLINKIDVWIPRSIVRGVQLCVGLKLVTSGLSSIWGTPWWGLDCRVLGGLCLIFTLLAYYTRRIPTALLLFVLGLILAAVSISRSSQVIHFAVYQPLVVSIAWPSDVVTGLLDGALPQLPLTCLNSVVALCALSRDLFPDKPRATKMRPVAFSVAFMNLCGCMFGALPMCHGAGGLAGQYRFGARSNLSILFLGATKMVFAILLGPLTLQLLRFFPASVLGVLLVISGLELSKACRDQNEEEAAVVMAGTTAAALSYDTGVGFLFGCGLALLLWTGRQPPRDLVKTFTNFRSLKRRLSGHTASI